MVRKILLNILLFIFIIMTLNGILSLLIDWGVPAFNTEIAVFAGLFFSFLHHGFSCGWKHAIIFFVIVFLVSLAFETVGVATGWVYGPYHYTEKLGWKFLGLVPVLIPMAWYMIMYPAYTIAEVITRAGKKRNLSTTLLVSAIGGLIMTSWDLAMDPLMVAGGNWVWERPGLYFGIPLQNFFGWWLTTFTVFLLFQIFLPHKVSENTNQLPLWQVLVLYTVACTGSVALDLLIGLPGPALVGAVSALFWLGLTLKRNSIRRINDVRKN